MESHVEEYIDTKHGLISK